MCEIFLNTVDTMTDITSTRPPPIIYSPKVFLGGLPYDITHKRLCSALSPFGRIQVELPHDHSETEAALGGFAYVIFERQEQVHSLLRQCKLIDGHYYYGISSQKTFLKSVEVLPWNIAGNKFSLRANSFDNTEDELKYTVFVGGIHGTVTAEILARMLDSEFGGVIRTRIDTDRLQYPIGSGVVVFSTTFSYFRAIEAEYIHLRTPKIQKSMQLDPYLVSTRCSIENCSSDLGPYFCRSIECFRYYCFDCYQQCHTYKGHATPMFRKHTSMTPLQQIPLTPANAEAFCAFISGDVPPSTNPKNAES